jgi:excisionase family DNA binding protein
MRGSELPLVLTVEEAARALRIGRGSCYEAVRQGAIPAVRIGRSLRIPRHGLLALLGDEPTNGEGPATNGTSAKLREQEAPDGSYPA